MRAVQITRFGGPEVLDVVDLPAPVPGDGEQLFDVSLVRGELHRYAPLSVMRGTSARAE
jgi:hypothetical protein